MAKGGGNNKRFQYCTELAGEILYLRALQGHSGRNPIDPSLQDTGRTNLESPCRMHELSVFSDFLGLFIPFIFLLSFLLNLKQFLLPFNFHEVEY